VPPLEIAKHVADKGGPPDYVAKNGERLLAAAQSIVNLAMEQSAAK
jgi:hypothetical protein